MSVNFLQFADAVNVAVPLLETEFAQKATQLIAKFNVTEGMPSVPTTDPFFTGGRFGQAIGVASTGLATAPVGAAIARDTRFADLGDQTIYEGAVKASKDFYDKWFGTPTADHLLTTAYTNLLNGTIHGLVDEYIAINVQEAKEINTVAMIKYNRDEDEIMAAASKFNTPRMAGPTYRELGLLKERTHEAIREELRKLGGEGLQRDYHLILATIEERLKLNTQAKRAMGEWISSIDDPLYAAKTLHDQHKIDGSINKKMQLMELSNRVQGFDRQGLSLANARLSAVRDAAFAPAFGRHDRNKLELNHLTQDLSALGTHLSGTYNRLRGSFGMSWNSATSQAIVRTTT